MTREELFSVFPRPWRLFEEEPGCILDATGAEVLQIDTLNQREEVDVVALAELIVDLLNEAEQ